MSQSTGAFTLSERPESQQTDSLVGRGKGRRRLTPSPPDARWDPTAFPADDNDDEPRWTELQLAAREGDIERVKKILSQSPNAIERQRVVNEPPVGWYSQTALQAACMREHEEVVGMLLAAGADIGAPGGNNIYMNAFEYACGTGNIRLVHLLLDAGATVYVNPTSVTRYQGRTPIQAAAESGNSDLIDLLLDLGADINAPASPCGGRTALQAACFAGHVDIVKQLISKGANLNGIAAKHGGFTALEAACRVGEKQNVDILLAGGADVNARGDSRNGGSALHAAAEGGHGEIVRKLLERGADCNMLLGRAGTRGQTAMQSAYVLGHLDVVNILQEAGALGPVNGGKRLYGHVHARTWSPDEMSIQGQDNESGRFSSKARQRAPSPNPLSRRTAYTTTEYSKLGQRGG